MFRAIVDENTAPIRQLQVFHVDDPPDDLVIPRLFQEIKGIGQADDHRHIKRQSGGDYQELSRREILRELFLGGHHQSDVSKQGDQGRRDRGPRGDIK